MALKKGLNRRSFINNTAGFTLGNLLTPSLFHGQRKNLLKEEDNFRAYIRLLGSLEPTTIYTWFTGKLWGILPNTSPKPLTTFEGLAKSIWDKKGDTLTKHSFDIGYFGDLETGEVLNEFKNPYTNKIVHPYHYCYGGGSKTEYKDGKTISGEKSKLIPIDLIGAGGQIWLEETSSASFDNPFNPLEWPLSSAGKKVHFGSSSTYVANEKALFDSQLSSCSYTLFWTAVNSWEPWLLMGQQPGYVMWRATGVKLQNVEEIPVSIKEYIQKTQPNYFEEGPPWEGRRSTWASYRKDRKPE